jgi:predicted RNase H-like nuclease (RuvC/YqgF family)
MEILQLIPDSIKRKKIPIWFTLIICFVVFMSGFYFDSFTTGEYASEDADHKNTARVEKSSAKLSETIQTQDRKIENLKSSLTKKEEKIVELKHNLQAKIKRNSTLERRVDDLKEVNENLKKEHKITQKKLEKAKDSNERITDLGPIRILASDFVNTPTGKVLELAIQNKKHYCGSGGIDFIFYDSQQNQTGEVQETFELKAKQKKKVQVNYLPVPAKRFRIGTFSWGEGC